MLMAYSCYSDAPLLMLLCSYLSNSHSLLIVLMVCSCFSNHKLLMLQVDWCSWLTVQGVSFLNSIHLNVALIQITPHFRATMRHGLLMVLCSWYADGSHGCLMLIVCSCFSNHELLMVGWCSELNSSESGINSAYSSFLSVSVSPAKTWQTDMVAISNSSTPLMNIRYESLNIIPIIFKRSNTPNNHKNPHFPPKMAQFCVFIPD